MRPQGRPPAQLGNVEDAGGGVGALPPVDRKEIERDMGTKEEITTQAMQIITEISSTLDALQAAAEQIMDSVAVERAALAAATEFCAPISPNGEKNVEKCGTYVR